MNPGAPQSRSFCFTACPVAGLVTLWTVLSLVGILFFHRIRIEVELGPAGWAAAGVAALAATLFEASVVILAIGALKQLACARHIPRSICYLLGIEFFAALYVVLVSIVMSWNFAFHQLAFLTFSVVRSALGDFVTLAPFLSPREIASIAAAGIAGVGAVGALFYFIPPLPSHLFKRLARFSAGAAILAVLSVRVIPALAGDDGMADKIHTAFESYTLPTMSLLWGPAIFYNPSSPAADLGDLARIESLESYTARIDKGKKRKNVIVFSLEALRADEVGNVVNGQETLPSINRLAKRGIHFTRAYSTGNESAYSMTSVVSGLYPLKFPQRDRFTTISYPLTRIYDLLAPVYTTAFISSANEDWQNMVAVTNSAHLDYFLDAPLLKAATLPIPKADSGLAKALAKGKLSTGKLDDGTTAEAVMDWITKTSAGHPDKPFFIFVSLQSSHYPYEQGFAVPPVFSPHEITPEEESKMSFLDYPRAFVERMRNRYRNSIHYSDAQIGRIADFLEQKKLLDDTIVIAFGDHGELFNENGAITHAAKLYYNSLHVALVVAGADKFPAGEYPAPVSLADLNPLILDAVDMPQFAGFQGRVPPGLSSLAPAKIDQFAPVLSTVQNIDYEDSVLVGDWKFVANPLGTVERLYNIGSDPFELQNLIGDVRTTRIATCLRQTLRDYHSRQISYYGSPDVTAAYFPPHYKMASFYCDPAMLDAL